jgi:hypothetical protein
MGVPISRPIDISQWDHHLYRALEPGAKDGNFAGSESVLLAAGPPMLSMSGGSFNSEATINSDGTQICSAYPIGMCQGLSIGQNRQQMRVFEIGGSWDYIISGKSVGQITISKAVYSSLSLLRVLYAYYATNARIDIKPLINSVAAASGTLNDVFISPGPKNMFINLASDLFMNPFGLMLIIRTSQLDHIATIYLERCVVHSHNLSIDPQGIIIQENASLSFGRIVPVHTESNSIQDVALNTLRDVLP